MHPVGWKPQNTLVQEACGDNVGQRYQAWAENEVGHGV